MTSSVCRCSSTTSAATETFGSCCTLDDLYDARRVAEAIGIPHYILNFERQFQETVISNFVREYAAGRTPLPCAHCNSDLKFATLLDRARGLGAEQRGDRALRARRAGGRTAAGCCAAAPIPTRTSRISCSRSRRSSSRARVFPVGRADQDARCATRPAGSGLQVAEKPDSQEICFVPDGDYASFVARKEPTVARAGAIVDERRRRARDTRGRAPLHRRPAQGSRRLRPGAALRAEDRRRVGPGDRRPARGARADDAYRVWGELDLDRRAVRMAARSRRRSAIAIAPPPAACARSTRIAPSSSSTSRSPPSRPARPSSSTTAMWSSAAAGSTNQGTRLTSQTRKTNRKSRKSEITTAETGVSGAGSGRRDRGRARRRLTAARSC